MLLAKKPESSIYVTGNTAIDVQKTTVCDDYHHMELDRVEGSRLNFITAHPRENLGEMIKRMFCATSCMMNEHSYVKVIYKNLLTDKEVYDAMAKEINPCVDGCAYERIAKILSSYKTKSF